MRLIVREDRYLRFALPTGESTFSVSLVDEVATEGTPTIYLECDDLDEQYARLVAAGVEFDGPPRDEPWLWREARLRDPSGNRLCLYRAGEHRLNPPWRV